MDTMTLAPVEAQLTDPLAPGALLNETQVALILGVQLTTLRGWRCYGRGPKFSKIGRHVRYFRGDLRDFIQRHTVEPAN